MKLFTCIFQRRLRGFRIIDLTAFACLSVLVLGVYAFTAHAGGESAKIADVDNQIADEQRRIRLLDANLAHLEQPERLEQLSTQYLGLAPVAAKQETRPTSLMEIARQGGSGAPGAATGTKPVGAASARPLDPATRPRPISIAQSSIAQAPASAPQ